MDYPNLNNPRFGANIWSKAPKNLSRFSCQISCLGQYSKEAPFFKFYGKEIKDPKSQSTAKEHLHISLD